MTPKDTLVVALSTEPTNLDPLFALDATSQRIDKLIYDSLVEIDSRLKIVPHLAESWENPKETLYRFKLRKDVVFHNGAPVTAHSVAQSLYKILDPATGSPLLPSFKNIKKVHVVSPHILEIELLTPQASFLTNLTIVKAMPEAPLDKPFIGSGPYEFVSKDVNRIILKRNTVHFQYKPNMETIIFDIVKDANTRLLKLKKGQIDLIQNELNADSLKSIENDPNLTLTKSAGLTYSYLGFNLKNPILKNLKVRKAIAHAIHRQDIIHHLLGNLAVPASSLLSPLNEYYEKNVTTYNYDPHISKALLKSLGIPLPIRLVYKTSTDTEAINIARLLADHLKKIGIEIDIRSHEWGTFFSDIQKGNFDLFSLRWVGITDPDIYYDVFHSSNFPPGKNRGYYSNPTIDKLVTEGKIISNVGKRKKIFSQVQKIIAQDLPYVSLWHWNNVAVYSNKLKGFYFHPQGSFGPFIDISK